MGEFVVRLLLVDYLSGYELDSVSYTKVVVDELISLFKD